MMDNSTDPLSIKENMIFLEIDIQVHLNELECREKVHFFL